MSTDEFTASSGGSDAGANVWSRSGNAMIVPSTTPATGSATRSAGLPDTYDADDDSAARTRAWSSVVSGPALAIAAFAFASAQAVGGLVAGPLSSLIPSAADSPANHVRIMAVIYIGMSCAGAVFAWLALRRCGDDADAPRWASYLAGAAVAVCALVALQAMLLLMLSILAPDGA